MPPSGCPVDATDQRRKITPRECDAAQPDKESDSAPRTFQLLMAGAAGMACLLALLPAAGHDQMWALYAARLMLHGARLYGPQLFETNPPLIMWMSMVPAAMAQALHLSPTAVSKFLVVALEAVIALIALKMLRSLRPALPRSVVWALAFVFLAVFAVMPARDFGQRDHLLALLCLPYLLAAAMAAEGRPLGSWKAVLAGVAAGAGIALKPHQVLIPVVVEAALLIPSPWQSVRRRFRPEPVAILACGVLYLLAIHLFTPEYLTRMVPILRATYWAFGHLTWPQLVAESAQLHILACITFAAFFAVGRRSAPPLVRILIAAGAAATQAYYLQGTGWYYQQLPALSFFALAFVFLAIDFAERHKLSMPEWTPKAAGPLSLLALALTTHFSGYPFTPERSFPIETPDPSFFTSLPPGTPVATLTTTVDYTMPPVFKYHLTLAQRYPHLWMLPGILRSESGERPIPHQQLARLEDLQHAAMREDFLRWQPRLVLIERCQDPAVHCQVLEDRHDNLLAWFLRDPSFREIFSHYHYLRSSGPFDAYVPN